LSRPLCRPVEKHIAPTNAGWRGGRFVARFGTAGRVVTDADVGTGTAPTLYARAGDWFAWLRAAALAGLLASTAPRRRRPGY
jgi:apolipoprotein N-acyltransferase